VPRRLGVGTIPGYTAIKELSAEEFDEYRRQVGVIVDAYRDFRVFWMVVENLKEIEETLAAARDAYVAKKLAIPLRQPDMMASINRCLLNFLSIVRVFLDHSETKLKARHGASSREVSGFKARCSLA